MNFHSTITFLCSLLFVTGVNIGVVDGRIYSFEVTLGSDSGAGTGGAIFFRVFGTNDIWSDWFSRTGFSTRGETYNWTREIIPSVGDATKVVVLSQQTDGFTLKTITIDTTNSYTIPDNPGADIDCTSGSGDPCSYVVVFFNGTGYIDHTGTYAGGGCDLDTDVNPTPAPTEPTVIPSFYPSIEPTRIPSSDPTHIPSLDPTDSPTVTKAPSSIPTINPTHNPSAVPSKTPSNYPTDSPTYKPSVTPTQQPISPTNNPTSDPTDEPSAMPTTSPSDPPTSQPTDGPVIAPTTMPSIPTAQPVAAPSEIPSDRPSTLPTGIPSRIPSEDGMTNGMPTVVPSAMPSDSDGSGIGTGNGNETDDGAANGSDDNLGLIIGGSIAAVAVLAMIGCLIFLVVYRKKNAEKGKALALKSVYSSTKTDTNTTKGYQTTGATSPISPSSHNITPGGPDDGGRSGDLALEGNPQKISFATPGNFSTAKVTVTADAGGVSLATDRYDPIKSVSNTPRHNPSTPRSGNDGYVVTALTSERGDNANDNDIDGMINEEKDIEYVTPGNIDENGNGNDDDDESTSSEAELEEIRNAMRNQQTGIVNVNYNTHNKRSSVEMNIQLAQMIEETDNMKSSNTNKSGEKHNNNNNNNNSDKKKKDKFGVLLNDGLVVEDIVVDDIIDEMNDEANGIEVNSGITPGGDMGDLAMGGNNANSGNGNYLLEGEGEGQHNNKNDVQPYVTPM